MDKNNKKRRRSLQSNHDKMQNDKIQEQNDKIQQDRRLKKEIRTITIRTNKSLMKI